MQYEVYVITKTLKDKFVLHRIVYNDYNKIIKLLITHKVNFENQYN